MDVLDAKSAQLEARLASMQAVVVAYSGGVDSSYLADVAHAVLGVAALAVTAVSPSLSKRARSEARARAAERGWRHVEVETHELDRMEYVRNRSDRCYWCKVELFQVLEPLASSSGAKIVLGTNADDLHDFRPGHRAARESGALTPLADVALTKSEIRLLSRARGLTSAAQPAAPCLASRFAYGVEVTEEGLRRIDAAEELVRSLGFDEFRVRDHGDLARVEVPSHEVELAARHRDALHEGLRSLGWHYVTLDLGGFRSGSLNEVLQIRRRAPGAHSH